MLDFNSPNTLELAMAYNPLPGKYLECLPLPVVVGFPMNQVQKDFPDNRHGGSYSAHDLNNLYLRGYEIVWQHFVNKSFEGSIFAASKFRYLLSQRVS
jgi:hypothetical protein